jgi:hypothetical protein
MVTAGNISMMGVAVRVGEATGSAESVGVIPGAVNVETEGVWITGGL